MVSTRSRVTAALCALLVVTSTNTHVLAASSPPSLYDYKYDGKTTYCYSVDQGMDVQNLDFAYVRVQASGNDCPLTMTIARSAAGGNAALLPLATTEYVFTATLNLATNAFNLHALPTYVPDPVTYRPVQIGHANVHTCSRTTVCDVFRTGSARKITTQETANFTGDAATFYQKIAFDRAGDYNVFAHVILPPANPQNASLHFITFMTTTVSSTNSDADAEAGGGLSTAAIIGIVIGSVAVVVLAVLAIVFCKRPTPAAANSRTNNGNDDMFRSSGGGFMPTLTTKHHSRLGASSIGSDWMTQQQLQLDVHNSDFALKDLYTGGGNRALQQSEYHQPPGLSASALAFHERVSSRVQQPATASSSGSFRASSPKAPVNNYDNFATPAASAPPLPLHYQQQQHANDYYGNGNGVSGFQHQLESDNFRIPSAIIKSFESDNSMGTSLGFNMDSHYAPYGHPGGHNRTASSVDDRESELSSIHADDDDDVDAYNAFAFPPSHDGLATLDESNSSSNDRLSDISMATVDFTLHRPQPPRAVPYQRELDNAQYVNTARPAAAGAGGTANRNQDDARETRTLSDGESYEF